MDLLLSHSLATFELVPRNHISYTSKPGKFDFFAETIFVTSPEDFYIVVLVKVHAPELDSLG